MMTTPSTDERDLLNHPHRWGIIVRIRDEQVLIGPYEDYTMATDIREAVAIRLSHLMVGAGLLGKWSVEVEDMFGPGLYQEVVEQFARKMRR